MRAPLVVLGATCFAFAIGSRPAFGQTEAEQKVDETQTETKTEETTTTETKTEETKTTETTPAEEVPQTTEAPDETPPPAAATESKAQKGAEVEELYITGSRIKRVDLTTPAPVTVLTRQDLDASGKQSIGDIIQSLPAQANGINIQTNNGGDGSTNIDLRGLGTARTLVLVNGRRMVYSGGSGAEASVDLNTIPSEIIERVEILKDGASAVYGSDAIAGVVNIITKKAFSGLELSTYMGGTSNGGFVYTLGATAGQRAEKGGFLLSFQWYDQSDLLAGQRNYTNTDLDYDYYSALHPGQDLDMDGKPDVIDPTATLGSSSVPEGYYRAPRTRVGNSRWEKLKSDNPGTGNIIITKDPVDGYRPFRPTGDRDQLCDDGTGKLVSCGDFYNYQPENYIVTPSKRISLWGHGDYELSKRATAYFEASYTNRKSEQLLAAEPLFSDTEGLTLTADNVYNPFGINIGAARRRLVEFSNRVFDQQVSTYRTVLGVNGSFTDEGFFSSWSWDANFIYGRNDVVATKQGSLVRHKLGAAIGPSFFDATGTAVCGTPDNPLPPEECTPLNLFGGPGSITPEQVNNLTYNGTSSGFAMQRMVNVGVGGSVFELWNRPVGLALGYAFRREDGGTEPDPLTAAGDTTGNKGLGVSGGFSENAAFAEIDVPLLADLPAVQLFELSAAVRGFNFSTFGGGATYKLGGRWQLFEHLALRGTYSTAFRAPSISELYSGAADNFPDVMDPCSTLDRSRSAEQDANCKADGVANDFEDDRAQLLSKVGGNPVLGAEEAKTFTAGLVVTPKGSKFLDGLSLTLDYYQIKVTNAIQAKGAEVIINNCYNFSNRSDCELVHRDSEGFVTLIDDLQTNVGGNTTAGFDIGLVYNVPTDFGSFRLNFDANVLQKFDDIRAARTISGKGVYDLEAVYAPLRFNTGIGWGYEGLSAGFNTRYTASFTECENNDCSDDARKLFSDAAAAAQDPNDPSFDPMFNDTIFHERTVSAYAISDLYAGYAFTSSLGYTSIQAGINNLFGTPPPRVYNSFAPNSDPSAYDFLGRFFYVGVRHSL